MTAPAPREIGRIGDPRAGPTLVVTGGMHGNEPAGVVAAEALLAALQSRGAALRGQVVALRGNTEALARGTRFIDRDLNRRWKEPALRALQARPRETLVHEDREQRELFECIEALERGPGPLVFFDLHTTSGPSVPFVCFSDTLENRRLALSLPVTAILGLEESIDGAMLGLCADRGHPAIAFEAGQHTDASTSQRHLAALWLLLVRMQLLTPAQVPELEPSRALLERLRAGHPLVVEVLHRHVVGPDDAFEMLPGFTSLDPIEQGQHLANDRRGEVRAPMSGQMLMPRYQPQGEDGYFLVRQVRPFWLKVSTVLRRSGAWRLLPALPGVTRDAATQRLVVDTGVARFRAIGLLHLCGYRLAATEGRHQVYARRAGAPSRGTHGP